MAASTVEATPVNLARRGGVAGIAGETRILAGLADSGVDVTHPDAGMKNLLDPSSRAIGARAGYEQARRIAAEVAVFWA